MKNRDLMDGYVGVKYKPICTGNSIHPVCSKLYPHFSSCGERLRTHGMTRANAGNMSVRVDDGIVITASGSCLGTLTEDDLVLVSKCSLADECVSYSGPYKPSSEAMLHWLVYSKNPLIKAIVHAHDDILTTKAISHGLPETSREEEYGTVALARLALDAFSRGSSIIMLRAHGYVAIGESLSQVTESIIRTHCKVLDDK